MARFRRYLRIVAKTVFIKMAIIIKILKFFLCYGGFIVNKFI